MHKPYHVHATMHHTHRHTHKHNTEVPTCMQSNQVQGPSYHALCGAENWVEAHKQREALLGYIQECSGIGTPLDPRRSGDYDENKLVDQFLNKKDVKVSRATS